MSRRSNDLTVAKRGSGSSAKRADALLEESDAASLWSRLALQTSSDPHEREANETARLGVTAPPSEGGVREHLGAKLGVDFSGVRVHRDDTGVEAEGAEAIAAGADVRLAPGRYRPESPSGRALLAHEFAHVAQQRAVPRMAYRPGGFSLELQRLGREESSDQLRSNGATLLDAEMPLSPAPRGMQQRCIGCEGCKSDEEEDKSDAKDAGAPASSGDATATPKPPAPDPNLVAVQSVKSLRLEDDLRPQIAKKEAALQKKIDARRTAIEKYLKEVGETGEVGKALKADLAKSTEDVIAKPDSKHVNHELRDDIVAAKTTLDAQKSLVAGEEVKFHRLDTEFVKTDVVEALKAQGFTPAELKALMSQESLDLTIQDTEGDIAGLGQLGAKEVTEVGGKPEDRLDDTKAILLAAKVLAHKAQQLKALLDPAPTGLEFKKFVYGAYNAGQSTIAEAQRQAKTMKRSTATWNGLIELGAGKTDADKKAATPLAKAIAIKLPKLDKVKKYNETTGYVEKILRRLK